MTWFAFFALGLSAYMGDSLVHVIQGQGGLAGPTFNAVAESLKYCVVMILMAIICFQAPSLASALTGGAAMQQGIQMIQNAMMVAGLRSSSRAAGSAAAGSGGGTVRAGVGIPYIAGQATGVAASAAGRVARHGAGAIRTAAYKLAAMRGRC
jgi:type IV secretion system protein VirB6